MNTKKKQLSKQQRTKEYLLTGKSLTGIDFGKKLNIENYRDVIYLLRKKGLDIVGAKEKHSDGYHCRYYMTEEAINKALRGA